MAEKRTPSGFFPGRTSFFRGVLAPAALVALTFLVYANSLSAGFVWDDKPLIIRKQAFFADPGSVLAVLAAPDAPLGGKSKNPYYRPLDTLSYMADHYLWGLNPFWYHLENVLLHALAVLLFYLLLAEVFKDRRLAFFSALLFAAYPLNTEAVDFISARNTLMCGVFSFASLLCLKKSFGFLGRGWAPAALFLFFLALMSKEPAVAAPFFLLTMALAPRPEGEKLRVKKGFFVFSLAGFFAILGLYFLIRHAVLGAFTSTQGVSLAAGRLKLIAQVYFENFRLLLDPFRLNALYVSRDMAFSLPKALLGAAGVVLLLYLSLARKTPAPVRAGAQWVFWGLLPVSNLVKIPSAPVADRFLYPVIPGFVLIAGYLITRLQGKRAFAATVFFAAIALALGTRTFQRNFVWRDNWGLYSSMERSNPLNPKAHYNMGDEYAMRGELAEAAKEFQAALSLDPSYSGARLNLGVAYAKQGRMAAAMKELKTAVELSPGLAAAHLDLGIGYEKEGRYEKAAGEFRETLGLDPGNWRALQNMKAIDALAAGGGGTK